MATAEENKAALERLLDNVTTNFHRLAGGHGENGTPLGMTSIGSGGWPSGGGTYSGYFDFQTKSGTTLVIEAAGFHTIDKILYLEAFESGRGHRILYFPTAAIPNTGEFPNSRERGTLYDSLDRTLEMPIDDAVMSYISGIIITIKKHEFWTVRKYALQSSVPNSIPKNFLRKSNFTNLVERAFVDAPSPEALIHFKDVEYKIAQRGKDFFVLEPIEGGISLSVPASRINPYFLEDEEADDNPFSLILMQTANHDSAVSEWRIAPILRNNYFYKRSPQPERR